MLHRLVEARPSNVLLQCAMLALEAEAIHAQTLPGSAALAAASSQVDAVAKAVLGASEASASNLLLWLTYAQVCSVFAHVWVRPNSCLTGP